MSSTIFRMIVCAAGVGFISSHACAACERWMLGPLVAQSEGINGIVECQTFWQPASGPPLMVVGGSFTTAGGVQASDIAAWDGASWRALGSGTDGAVWCLGVFNGELIAGGEFSNAGGLPASHIARWNGSTWQPLGSGLGGSPSVQFPTCRALTVFNGQLIAGGTFATAGGVTCNHVARWNGTTWNSLAGPAAVGVGGSVPANVDVRALQVLNNVLFIGGSFQTAASIPASNIASWDGTANGWHTLGGTGKGVNNIVHALGQFNGELTVGGEFTMALTASGNLAAPGVAHWNPTTSTWGAFGSGVSGTSIFALQNFNGGILAGGWSNNGGPNLAFWNGSTWSLFNGGVAGPNTPFFTQVSTLFAFNGNIVVGGWFTSVGGGSAFTTNIAQWNPTGGSTGFWSSLQVPRAQIGTFELLDTRIVAGGAFTHSTTNFAPTKNLISWNGTTLAPVGGGVNGQVRALKSFSGGGQRHLVVGGDFTFVGDPAGGLNASRVAQWNESDFIAPSWQVLGSGLNASVQTLERFNNVIYAGGLFTASGATAINRVAQFNGTNWVPLPGMNGSAGGTNGPVNTLKVFNGFLYVGGSFTTAGGLTTGGLARWNGTAWSTVGTTFNGTVFALEVHNNELIVGGQFSNIGGASNVVRFNGTTFSSMSSSSPNGVVSALKSDGTNVYCAGGFTSVSSLTCFHLGRWNATTGWDDLDGGTSEVTQALGAFHGEIHVGLGIVLSDDDGGIAAAPQPGAGWVRYSPTDTPWFALQPVSHSVGCGQSVSFTVQPAPGYFLLLATWRKNGVALADGLTAQGSTISGAHAATLTISNVTAQDAGAYDCQLGGLCGGATSSPATLTITGCCEPDVNGSGAVNVDDLLAVISGWGACPAPPIACPPDVAPAGGNGVVNVDDMLAVIAGWGACP